MLRPIRKVQRAGTWIFACVFMSCSGDPAPEGGAGRGNVPPFMGGGNGGAAGLISGAGGDTAGGARAGDTGSSTGGAGAASTGGAGAASTGGAGAASTGGGGSGGGAAADAGRARAADSGRAEANAIDSGRAEASAIDSGRAEAAASDSGRAAPPRTDGSVPRVTVYLAGDSTVSEYRLDPANPKSWAGWGQMLQPHYDSNGVTVLDRAVGGMTARHFILGGNLAAILSALKAGDYLFVQFGTNDSNTGAMFTINGVDYPYFADANTDFKTYLQQYIDGARAKSAIPVLVTPPPRNSAYCNGPRSLENYGQAMIQLGAAQNVAVVDLGRKTWSYLNVICPKPVSGTTETFFKVTGTTIDGTHFQENGARVMAGFVADGVGEVALGLDVFRIK